MDPQAALDAAQIHLTKGKKSSGWRALQHFAEGGESLNNYWEWRQGGGFEPKGGDRRAEDIAEELSDAWEKESDAQDQDRAVHADYFENPGRAKKRHSISKDMPILPEVVAAQVINEVESYIGKSLDSGYSKTLVTHAHETYNANESFRKKIQAGGNRGRDQLYAFMRHWLAAELKEKQPDVYRQLPKAFSDGKPLGKRKANPGTSSASDLVGRLKF